MIDEEDALKIFGKDVNGNPTRLPPSYVPRGFMERNASIYMQSAERDEYNTFGMLWLKQALIGERNIPGTFAKYFTDDEERGTAIIRTGSIDYFPRYRPLNVSDTLSNEARQEMARGYALEPGYAQFIDPRKVDIINTMLAVYALTDSSGTLDTSRVQTPDFPRGTYTQRLTLPAKQ